MPNGMAVVATSAPVVFRKLRREKGETRIFFIGFLSEITGRQ
jgi:hypothetical protein